MDFKQIEAFIAVAKLKSFSKAANEVYLSQPTISSHILNLEKELGIQLFDRNSKEVNLTPAGKCFLEYAIDILNTRNTAISKLSYFNNTIYGKLNLAASTASCSIIVPLLIDRFLKIYPQMNFNIKELSSGEVIKDIIELNSEIGIVGSLIENDKIKSYCLMEDFLVLIANINMDIPSEIDIEELFKYKFVMREKNSATRKTFETALENLNYPSSKLNVYCEVNSLHTLIHFVKIGLGVSIISKQVAEEHISSGKLKYSIIKNLSLKRNIYLVTNSKRTLTPGAKAFINMCKNYFKLKY